MLEAILGVVVVMALVFCADLIANLRWLDRTERRPPADPLWDETCDGDY